eukprot:TRINITY_DN3728_c0_g1_i1.p1 TRINITY_DN3728_c0_g1~~TRINITY_DN3728_c0_g1_i1.p1  ORF type:complete len:663 (-),score=117.89 TRINITY_DN3728_c0_g1_i1:1323-3311(-)
MNDNVVVLEEEASMSTSNSARGFPPVQPLSSNSLLKSSRMNIYEEQMKSGLFGMKYWSIHAMGKNKRLKLEQEDTEIFGKPGSGLMEPGNIFWVVFFGWWLALIFLLGSLLCYASYFAKDYGLLCYHLAKYMLFPFGKFIVHSRSLTESSLGESYYDNTEKSALFGQWRPAQRCNAGYGCWIFVYCLLILPALALSTLIFWLTVVMVPMAKVNWSLMRLLYQQPLLMVITQDYSAASSHPVLLCTYHAFSKGYTTYSLFGINIFFLNAIPVVVIRTLLLIVSLITGKHYMSPIVSFFFDLVCAVPITFFIGLSISCITIQTNYMIGALLNASFGSLTELILFSLAMRKGALNDLILYSLTGGLLNDMLLIPGLSMIAGGIKYKQQKFNTTATGVSSVLFFVAIIGAFFPSIFYKAFGGYQQVCTGCVVNGSSHTCEQCHYVQTGMDKDPLFTDGVLYLIYVVTALLPIAYIIGLFFTFKTHRHMFAEDEEEGEGEDAPEWTISVSIVVMVVSILTFGLIAEDVVEIVQSVLEELGVEQSFLGVTLIALTPAATEIANAVRFALTNQISLSVQIGAASAVQVALVQMPCLTLLALVFSKPGDTFHLIFPTVSIFAVTLSVFAFNYISMDGNTNYFIGCVLVTMYVLLITTFYFVPSAVQIGFQ